MSAVGGFGRLTADATVVKYKPPEPKPEIHIRQCRHGVFAYFPHDFYLGGALERYGEYA